MEKGKGKQGKGKKGKNKGKGKEGKEGKHGKDGKDGKAGKEGKNGKDGKEDPKDSKDAKADSKMGKDLLNEPFFYMADYINKMPFKSFGIGYEHLIIKFMSEGLLPKNFFQIK